MDANSTGSLVLLDTFARLEKLTRQVFKELLTII